MIAQQTLDRTFEDSAKTEALSIGCFGQLVTEMPGNTAHKRNGHLQLIWADIITEEIAEIINHQTSHSSIREMAMDERCKRCQEAIRHRFTINPLDDI